MSRETADSKKNRDFRNSNDIMVLLPCIVLCYDSATHSVGVIPAINEPSFHGQASRTPDYEPMQTLAGIKVQDVMGVRFIPEVGSRGDLKFYDKDIVNYIETGAASDPDTPRIHDYSDAVFMPSDFTNAKPEPYVQVGCDFVKINFDVESEQDFHIKGNLLVDGDIGATGDVTAMNGTVSLNNLATQYASHVHVETGAVTVVTTMQAYQGQPVIMEPKICDPSTCA